MILVFPIYHQFPNKPHSCRSILTEEQIHSSLMYKEVLSRVGVEYSLGVKLDDLDERNFTAIALLRGKNGRAFSEDEASLMSEYIPHIKRALKLHERFSMLEYSYSTALEAFDKISIGIIFINKAGKIKFRNKYAAEILNDADGVEDKDGHVCIMGKEGTAALSSAIAKIFSADGAGKNVDGASFSIDKTHGNGAYAAHISPFVGRHLSFDLRTHDEKSLILFIVDPDKTDELPKEVLQRLFGLTKSESEILELLVSGKSTEDIAALKSISKNTVKTHVKSLFDKTQTHKQSELIRLVISTPTWIRFNE